MKVSVEFVKFLTNKLNLSEVKYLPSIKGSVNKHLIAQSKEIGNNVFIKLYKSFKKYAREGYCYKLIKNSGMSVKNTMDVVTEGENFGIYWRAFIALELHNFYPIYSEDYVNAGMLLGEIHKNTINRCSPKIRQYQSIIDCLHLKIKLIHSENNDTDFPYMGLFRHFESISEKLRMQEKKIPKALLHGDFGWRNIAIDKSSSDLVIYDFEDSAFGPVSLDFAKLLDRELKLESNFNLFMSGYSNSLNHKIIVSREYWQAVSLWCALGILPYAKKTQDTEFKNHALQILDKLNNEI